MHAERFARPSPAPGGRRLAAALALLAALPAAAHAQTPAPLYEDTIPRYRLEDVRVTVTRAESERAALPRQIEIVTRTDIERTPAADVAELLKKQATADVIQFPGLLAGIGLRGFRPQFSGISQRTLVLIDGRPAGATNLALLTLDDIERVEVLKGPASALYGSSAMGGAVNLVTRRSAGAVRSSVSLGYGSWDTRQGTLAAGGSLTPELDFDLSLRALEQAGDYRVGRGNFFRDRFGDTAVVRTYPDGRHEISPERGDGEVRPFSRYGTRSGSLRLGYRLGDGWRVDGRAEGLRAERVQNPGDLFYAWGDGRSLKNVARSSGDLTLARSAGIHSLRLRGFFALEEGENFNAPEATDARPHFVDLHTWTRWRGLQLQDAVRLGAHTLIAGLDYTRTHAESERFGAPAQRIAPWEPDSEIDSRAAFAEAHLRALDERLVATLGGRLDRIGFAVHPTELWDGSLAEGNRESFTVFNPSFGLQYATPGGLRLHGSGGRAFVAPTAFQVAARVERRRQGGVELTRGNPALDPENSFTWDAGIGVLRAAHGLDADVTYFQTRVRDRITSRRTTPPAGTTTEAGEPVLAITTYVNADDAQMRGLEARLAYDFGARRGGRYVLRPYASATRLLRAEETIGGERRAIRNVAELTVGYGMEYDDLRRFSTRLSGRYVGERTDDDWNVWPAAEVRYPAFMTLDWTAELRLAERVRLGLLVSNLTDENYYEVRGYPLPGRAAQLRLAVDF